MKTLFVTMTGLFLILTPVLVNAQTAQVEKLFDKYSGAEGFTTVDISKGLFELFANLDSDDPDFDEFQKAVQGIEKMRLIAWSSDEGKSDPEARESFMKTVKSSIPFNEYDELMVVKEKDTKINFYAKSVGQNISEMLMVVDGIDDAVVLSMWGNIDLGRITKLGSSINMGGMNYLNRMDKSHNTTTEE